MTKMYRSLWKVQDEDPLGLLNRLLLQQRIEGLLKASSASLTIPEIAKEVQVSEDSVADALWCLCLPDESKLCIEGSKDEAFWHKIQAIRDEVERSQPRFTDEDKFYYRLRDWK